MTKTLIRAARGAECCPPHTHTTHSFGTRHQTTESTLWVGPFGLPGIPLADPPPRPTSCLVHLGILRAPAHIIHPTNPPGSTSEEGMRSLWRACSVSWHNSFLAERSPTCLMRPMNRVQSILLLSYSSVSTGPAHLPPGSPNCRCPQTIWSPLSSRWSHWRCHCPCSFLSYVITQWSTLQ